MPSIYYLSPNALWVLKNGFARSISKQMSPRRRSKKPQVSSLSDFDHQLREKLSLYRDKFFQEDWWPRQGSEDDALLKTLGMEEFIQGLVEEEDLFKEDWNRR